MRDTSPEIEAKMRDLIRQKTPQERLAMGCSMFDFSKELMTKGFLSRNPGLSDGELKIRLFLALYGKDFDSRQKQNIIRRLDKR